MAVTLIIGDDVGSAVPMLAWGRRFAAARGLGLDVVQLSRSESDLPELELVDGESIRALVAVDQFQAVVADVTEKKPELVLLARQSPGEEDDSRGRLVRRLFMAMHCDTIMLRTAAGGGEDCKSVLVPASGGPHSLTALGWAKDLVMADGDGQVVPLFVEPDTGDEATEVGGHLLAKILKRAGISPDAPGVLPQVVLADDVRAGIVMAADGGEHDLLLVGASGVGVIRSLLFGTIPERLFKGDAPMAVAVVRQAAGFRERVRNSIERWLHLKIPQLERDERVKLFENIETNAKWSFDFMMLICLSTAIAGVGLMINSTAVVIGAMLVAPLMTPLLGSGLALVQGNLPLMRSAARAIIYGFFAALLIGIVLGYCSIEGSLTSEMESRGGPGPPDMVIAFLSGVAASYCIARPNLSSALAGVAIAAALVPPIATVGIAIAFGELGVARGAAILFATNVVAIILGAALTFYATGIRARRAPGRKAVWVRRTVLGLVLCALALAFPLGSALISKVAKQVVDEPQQRSFFRVTDSVNEALEKEVEELGSGARLEGVRAYREGESSTLELDVIAEQVPEKEWVESLAKRATKLSGEPTKVRVLTRLVVESQ